MYLFALADANIDSIFIITKRNNIFFYFFFLKLIRDGFEDIITVGKQH